MKFKFVKQVVESAQSYGGHVVKTGDIIELDGHLARKAAANPDYQLVAEENGDDIRTLREAYKDKFGAYPHHKKSAEKIKAELNGDES